MADDSDQPDGEALVDAVLVEFGGDARAAIKALLHDIDTLARDFSGKVSRGYVRHEKAIWLKTVTGLRVKGDG